MIEKVRSSSVYSVLCLALIFAALANSASASTRDSTRAESLEEFEKNENYAVIVGVNRYASDDIGNLRFAGKDAQRLSEYFTGQGYDVKTLIDYEASPQDILGQVNKAATLATNGSAEEGGNVVFAFSGHGFRDRSGRNYLATGQTTLADLKGSALPLQEVKDVLREAGVRQRVLFIDCCRNIPGQKSLGSDTLSFSLEKEAQGEAVLYSTRAGELSREDEQLGHGVFTHYLIDGLSGSASGRDGLITFDQLQKHVARGVKRHVSRRFDEIQIPYQGGERSSLGEFVLARADNGATTPVETVSPLAALEAAMGLSRADKRLAQSALNTLGFSVRPEDGLWGRSTRAGIARWQSQQGYPASGYLEETSYKELVAELVLDSQAVLDSPVGATAAVVPCNLPLSPCCYYLCCRYIYYRYILN